VGGKGRVRLSEPELENLVVEGASWALKRGLAKREEPADREIWRRVERIAAEELWRTHERRRERLVAFVRRRLRSQRERQGLPQAEVEAADEVLDPEALTIGFARRFATYKRATLLLLDTERLAGILNSPERPLQIIYAGKAHPQDDAGKDLIAQIVRLSRQKPFRRRLVFLENYNMDIARYLAQGADVWLNTPRRPHEACGTSGMKAAANGVLNLSILDGWWDEAYQPQLGWAIGRGETYDDPDYQDQVEAEALYDLLEWDILPTFYDRGADGLPRRWISYMKASIGSLCHFFNAHRMVQEYTERYYLPVAERYGQLSADEMERAKALAAWKARVHEHWPEIRVESVDTGHLTALQVGEEAVVQAQVLLGDLKPDDVRAEFYLGRVTAVGEITDAEVVPMQFVGQDSGGGYVLRASSVLCNKSGLHGYTVRVLPCHTDLAHPFVPGLIAWASPDAEAGDRTP
jgi:starch phosphorylase